MRPRGSRLGNITDPSQYSAGGVWSPIEMMEWRHKNLWPAAGVGDALDPLSKGTGITLSNNNRRATNDDYSWGNVRGLTGRSTGKWYFEVLCVYQQSGYVMCGVDQAGGDLNTYPGANPGGYCYQATGQKWHNGSNTPGTDYTTNDIIGVAVDLDAGEIRFYKNNTLQGGDPAYSGLSGTYYPVVGLYGNYSPGISMEVALQSAQFTYSPPGGYSAWVAG